MMKDVNCMKVFVVLLTVVALVGAVNAGLVDDFESYDVGNVRDVASPPWTAIGNTGFADVEEVDGNKYLTYGWWDAATDNTRGAFRNIPNPVADTSTAATLYQRLYVGQNSAAHSFGLSDVINITGNDYSAYEIQMVAVGVTATTFKLQGRDGAIFNDYATDLLRDTWYNVWAVIDQTTDTYDIYLNTGTTDATISDLVSTGVGFRNGTNDALASYLGLAFDSGENVRLDDISLSDGVVLSVPEPATMALLGIGGITALLRRKK